MKVYVYKNGLCDPAHKIGTCRQFAMSVDVDEFVGMFVYNIERQYLSNYRIFITNDEVDFIEMDHYVLMNENIFAGQSLHKKIREVNLIQVRREVDHLFDSQLKKQEEIRMKIEMDRKKKGPN